MPRRYRCAKASLINTARGASGPSLGSSRRPLIKRTPITEK
jgi:hypothetical protein